MFPLINFLTFWGNDDWDNLIEKWKNKLKTKKKKSIITTHKNKIVIEMWVGNWKSISQEMKIYFKKLEVNHPLTSNFIQWSSLIKCILVS